MNQDERIQVFQPSAEAVEKFTEKLKEAAMALLPLGFSIPTEYQYRVHSVIFIEANNEIGMVQIETPCIMRIDKDRGAFLEFLGSEDASSPN